MTNFEKSSLQYLRTGKPVEKIPVRKDSIFYGKTAVLSDKAKKWLDFSRF